ncbi:MAG: radical SAM protein [Candidatus Symbiothrix sp.]|nr:radical SAM protein [Candidatus Symbiothrix sp.]
MNIDKKIVFNHFYKLRHDIRRSHILAPSFVDKKHAALVQPRWMSRIHPVYAMIFSFMSEPVSFSDLTKELSYFLEMPEEDIETLIKPFISNNEIAVTNYKGVANFFPRNIVIEEDQLFNNIVHYMPQQFAYKEIDLERERFYTAPASILFMVNNYCYTDCVYCYANKSVRTAPLSFDKIKDIIIQAKKLGIAAITVVGGEVFLYKNWKELFDFLIENGYKESLVSTKVPLNEEDIIAFEPYGIPIQISLDSLDSEILKQVLNVKSDYGGKIKQTISNIDKHGIDFQVATVLTKHNESIDNLKSLHDFLAKFKKLRRWEIRVGFKSLYSRGDFDRMKLSKDSINNINQWVEEIKKTTSLNIQWSIDTGEKYFKSEEGSRKFTGSRCSANYSNMVILPDGKVTICEQLYWNPRFIIGDVSKQSVEEVWNSPRAIELAFPKKEHFRDESVCKKCSIFEKCLSFPNKCYADVLKGYGDKNWDYPDPRCAKAPRFINELQAL